MLKKMLQYITVTGKKLLFRHTYCCSKQYGMKIKLQDLSIVLNGAYSVLSLLHLYPTLPPS